MISEGGLGHANMDFPEIPQTLGCRLRSLTDKVKCRCSSCDKRAERWVQTGESEADAWMSTRWAKRPKNNHLAHLKATLDLLFLFIILIIYLHEQQ